MKKIISIVFVSLFLSFFVFSANTDIDFSVSPSFGMMFGKIQEYVYLNNVNNYNGNYLLSRLDWDVKPISYFSVDADLKIIDHIFIGISGKIGLPGYSGKMIDNDWLNYSESFQTNYSEHKNYVNEYYFGKVTSGGIIYLPNEFFILPNISFLTQYFFFQGKEGWAQYGAEYAIGKQYPYNDENEEHLKKYSFVGRERVITYSQLHFFSFIGIKIGTEIIPKTQFSFMAEFSPFAWISANDKHYSTDEKLGTTGNGYYRDFLDEPKGFGSWNFEFVAKYVFNTNHSFGLKTSYFYVPILVGPDGMKKISDKQYYLQSDTLGGCSANIFSFQLVYTFCI